MITLRFIVGLERTMYRGANLTKVACKQALHLRDPREVTLEPRHAKGEASRFSRHSK